MATITKRAGKRGTSYRIQVYVKNKGTGQDEYITTTWRPPDDVPEREASRLLKKFVVEFEEKCRQESMLENALKLDLTLSQYSDEWLKSMSQNRSASYYSSTKQHLKKINDKLGGYKLNALNPVIIQRFIDGLKKQNFIKGYAVAKTFKQYMAENKIKQIELSRKTGVSVSTIKAAFDGEHIDTSKAKLLAGALNMRPDELFEIVEDRCDYKPASIAKTVRTLRAMLGMAKRQQLIEHNYASSEYITSIKQERHEILCFDESQAKAFAHGLMEESDIRIKTALMLILLTGLRRGEAAGLEWQDIDFSKDEISVRRSSVNVAGMGVVTGKTKSVTSTREITMPAILAALMRDYRLWWEDYIKALGDRYNGCNRVFVSQEGDRLHPCTFRNWLQKTTQKLGLPNVNIHSLRHTNITLQILAGVPLKTVSTRAGHSTTKLTIDTYWQYFKASDREAAETLNKIFIK